MAPEASPSSPSDEGTRAAAQKQASLARRSKVLGFVLYYFVRSIYATLRITFENMDRIGAAGERAILVAWHGRSLLPANAFRGRGYWALISLSRDGELQNEIFKRFGFHTIRGSSGRGGVRGALQMARKVREGAVLAFTPDGPRGPTHKVQPGVLLMAEKSGAPIIPIATSVSRRWLLRSWDSYMLPKPFARAYFLVGEPIHVPPGLDEAGRERIAHEIEVAMNRLEREAEARAGFSDYPTEWPTE